MVDIINVAAVAKKAVKKLPGAEADNAEWAFYQRLKNVLAKKNMFIEANQLQAVRNVIAEECGELLEYLDGLIEVKTKTAGLMEEKGEAA